MTTADITSGYFDFEDMYEKHAKAEREKEVRRNEKSNKIAIRRAAILKKDKKATITAIFVIGFILISAVVVSAYTANLKYENNQLISQNEELQDEIDMLNIEIQTATNLSTIEKIAINKYGMVYPDTSQFVYVSDKDLPDSKFASTIKKKAYN